MKKTLRRLGSFLLVLAMLMAIMPAALAADEVTVYLKPSSNWLEGSARFAVYYFNAGEGWVSMTDAGDGYYSASVPAGVTVIFCRMNPGNTTNSWDNKWNQTADLTLPTDDKNCFYAPEGTWDGATNSYWGTMEEAPDVPEPVLSGYTVAGVAELTGYSWDPTQNGMTETTTGIWEITFTDIPAGTYEFKVTDGSWSNSWGNGNGDQNASVTLNGVGDVTVTFNEDTKEVTSSIVYADPDTPTTRYTVAGESGLCGVDWDPVQNPMTETSTGIWEITFSDVAAGTYKFKVTDGSWSNSWGEGSGDATVTLAAAGDVTITFNADTKEITTSVASAPVEYTVTIHFLPEESWGSNINAWLWMNDNDDIPGYEDYHDTWPGKAVSANADHEGWYDMVVVTEDADGFKYIFNDGSNQTADLLTGALTGDLEIWLVGQTRHDTAPEEWTGVPTYTYTVYYHNISNWPEVYAYTWDDSGEQLLGPWAGTQASAVEGNDGWYSITLTVPADEINLIFNSGEGSQTDDLKVASQQDERKVEAWIDASGVSYTAPDGWNEVVPGNTVKIHFMAPYTSWGEKIYAWLWNGSGDVPGYEAYHKNWPGKRVEADNENPGWYYLEVTTELPGFNFIFSGKRQTADLHTGQITGDMEIWVYGNDIYDYKPDVLPATGDNTNVTMLAGMMILSVLAMGAVVIGRKKLA